MQTSVCSIDNVNNCNADFYVCSIDNVNNCNADFYVCSIYNVNNCNADLYVCSIDSLTVISIFSLYPNDSFTECSLSEACT
jgi:uncharacterized protein YjbI with pentapeptide repeats